jgi:hypothetical protein
VVEPGRGAGDRAAAMRGGQPIEVGHKRAAQRGGGIPHPLGKALPEQAGRVDRLFGEHAEVKHHLPGGVGGTAVMTTGFACTVPGCTSGQ